MAQTNVESRQDNNKPVVPVESQATIALEQQGRSRDAVPTQDNVESQGGPWTLCRAVATTPSDKPGLLVTTDDAGDAGSRRDSLTSGCELEHTRAVVRRSATYSHRLPVLVWSSPRSHRVAVARVTGN